MGFFADSARYHTAKAQEWRAAAQRGDNCACPGGSEGHAKAHEERAEHDRATAEREN